MSRGPLDLSRSRASANAERRCGDLYRAFMEEMDRGPLGAALPGTMSLVPGRFSPQARIRIGLNRAEHVQHRRRHRYVQDAMLLLHFSPAEVVRYPDDQHGHALKAAA